MYHCHIQFYLVGSQRSAFEIIKKMQPLEHFTHEFTQSDIPEKKLTAGADVILAYLKDEDIKDTVKALVSDKKEDAELILFADAGSVCALKEESQITDIWQPDMTDEEVRFRFSRWQQAYKVSKDLWQSKNYMDTLMSSTPNLVWCKDIDGLHNVVNDSFCQMVGKTKKQVIGRDHAYIWNAKPGDPDCSDSDNEAITQRHTCISEEIIKADDGMKILETYKSPLYDIDGSVMGTAGVAVDVTQERTYQQEILKKNQTLEKIFTNIDCGVIRHTLDGNILSINRAALEILGYESKDELIAAGFKLISPSVIEKDKKKLREKIQTLKKEGDSIGVNYRVRHKNGDIVYVVADIKLMMEDGELIYQRFLLDCTDQKLNERRNMELVYALSVDYKFVCFLDLNTSKGMVIQNDGTVDREYMAMFDGEKPIEESVRLYIDNFVYEDDKPLMTHALSLENLKAELSYEKMFYVYYRAFINGKILYYQMKAVRAGTWEDNQGIVIGVRCVDDEIRKDMEKRDLLENALLQANKASEAKSAFLSNMSHDIRTPMNAIVGFTNLAIAHIDNTEQVKEYLGKIMTSGNHLLRLINNVLDMSRIESGKVQLEEKPCNLIDIMNGLRSILQADINAKHMQLEIDTEHIKDINIYCDVLRLDQVLLNLVSNSVKYTRNGGTVSVKVTQKGGAPEGYANYEFLIKDNGIGMSEEFVQHIFEPFEREKNSTLSGVQGTGLGMAITKNIVDMMAGSIDVKSELGKGTEFTLCLMMRLYSEELKQQPVQTDKESVSNSKRHTGRILLTEDVELNQEVATAILSDAGFEVEIADNGQIAVDMLKKSKPGYYKLVLMDVQMPVMNGYEAAKEIRKLEDQELSTIPIIAMTANAFEEDKQEAIKCGMNGHIAKPIDIGNLFETLDSILC
ncbi:MAG: ATP-binding protein [Butyrivibrio sp.]|nr:ATP-binding protein [Butyrivibrio sp.]